MTVSVLRRTGPRVADDDRHRVERLVLDVEAEQAVGGGAEAPVRAARRGDPVDHREVRTPRRASHTPAAAS